MQQEQTHHWLASAFSILIWGNLNQSIYAEKAIVPSGYGSHKTTFPQRDCVLTKMAW